MKKILSSQGLKLAIVGAALATAGVAVAGGAGPQRFHHDRGGPQACAQYGNEGFHQGRAHGMHHGGKGGHGHHAGWRHAGFVVPGYGIVSRDFVDGMGLNADQTKLVEEARSAAREVRENRRDRMKAERAARGERYSAGVLNPEQALKQADEKREQAQAERRKVEEKWLAVWKSLDAGQQARVADHLKQRAEKAQQRAEMAQQRAEKQQERRQQGEAAKRT